MNASHKLIGIMADSHGDPDLIERGAVFLKSIGCETLVHLGDICDTTAWETADACIDRIQEYGIVAVKGNNDHSLTIDASGRKDSGIRRQTLVFLEDLPLIRHVEGATMVHSRPFIQRLGLSALVGMIGKREAGEYFRDTPDGLMFRGHSHQPEIVHQRDQEIRFIPLDAGHTVDLDPHRPCIVTCGALMSGWVMIWDPQSDRLVCSNF